MSGSRPVCLKSWMIGWVLLSLTGACGPPADPPANLVLVVFDALRPDHTGPYGYQRNTTPTLDALAEEAILFETAVAPAAFTLPSMATLFTGLNPPAHGVRRHLDPSGIDDRLESSYLTLAEQLKSENYTTGAVVSNSLFLMKFGFDQGFDLFDAGRRRDAEPTTDAALAFLDQVDEDLPFFLWVHYIDPHWPYDTPGGFRKPFSHADGGEYEQTLFAFNKERLRGDEIYFGNRLSRDGLQRGIAEYDNEIAYADHHLGRLLDRLKEKGLYRDTVLAVVSDHGEALGEHGLTFAHSFYLYDEIQKVVMLLKPSRWHEQKRIEQPVRLLDFLPTVLSMLGLPAAADHQGVDLSTLWQEGAREKPWPERPAYAESEPRYRQGPSAYRYPSRRRVYAEGNAGKWRMLRTERFKVIQIPGEGLELYDLLQDPDEKNNLSEQPPEGAMPLIELLDRMVQNDREPGAGSTGPEEDALRVIREMGY